MAKRRARRMLEAALKEKDPERAKRYFKLAKRIGMRNKVRLGKEKQLFCRFCGAPPSSLQIRLKQGDRVIICKKCGRSWKIPFKP